MLKNMRSDAGPVYKANKLHMHASVYTLQVKVKVDRSCMIEIVIISQNLIQWKLRS